MFLVAVHADAVPARNSARGPVREIDSAGPIAAARMDNRDAA
jgi:hypothetical protein